MRFKDILFIVSAISLTGCGLAKPEPLPRIQTVHCLTPEQFLKLVQAEPEKIGQHLSPDLQEQNKQLKTQNVLVRQYADGLLQVLGGCTGPVLNPS
jgi:hypothetical protein